MPEEKLVTVKEAHGMITERIKEKAVHRPAPSVATLYRWLNEGKVFRRAMRVGMGGWLIPRSEVERVLQEENVF